ncbi:type IV pilus twitching motility protein PilT [Intestinibacter bartlettii]|uniref:Type IV pilus twitching motility protein PilT n=1 Tax=Intestinibacter bartlettii TaxID=261299 RepID=A0ABS6DWW4_9FIRM|nr:type IV pilus twitching motility protein PilT [Intestinibacter bartlettii]MBU5336322.1 type IV pilus twitching motility protein PilT [Intestinibacter bartlettii]MDO5009461.1 type IV pilus twitching motility protein PilT [Intestinibacter bartlettii]
MNLLKILDKAVQLKASDVHITVGLSPVLRVNGRFKKLSEESLTNEDVYNLLSQIANKELIHKIDEKGEIDFSVSLPNKFRVRVNAYKQKSNYAIAIRIIPNEIPKFEELKLPDIIKQFATKQNGLILITGPTGSGKSSTLASLIDLINETRECHIITLEDPIEYVHNHKKSIVNQREIGRDSKDFNSALRASLRQDPDVILIGEMRDAESISIALRAAETGHLVFSTMHTIGAAKTIDRIIDTFDASKQQQIRSQLSTVCVGIVSQQLIPTIDEESRIVATEVMIANTAIKNLIRENKIYQIQNIIQTSSKQNMFSMDQDVSRLYKQGLISKENLISRCNDLQYIKKIVHI